jgi:hypothetical protein
MTDRMRLLFGACLTALLATELVRRPVVHFDETTNNRVHHVEHIDPFRYGGPKAPDALIERAGDVDNQEIDDTGDYRSSKSSARSKRPRNSSGESNYP